MIAWVSQRHATLWREVQAHLIPGELAHDGLHLQRVYAWAIRLAPEAGVSADLAGAAALVHDLAAVAKESPQRATGGERSAVLAQQPLATAGYDQTEIAAVVEAVRTSSWSRGLAPTTALGALLQDADRLDAIGAIGIARVFACAQQMSSATHPGRFYDPDDAWATNGRTLDDRRQALDHFAAKLLKLATGMHLPAAIAEGKRRHVAMTVFIAQLRSEI